MALFRLVLLLLLVVTAAVAQVGVRVPHPFPFPLQTQLRILPHRTEPPKPSSPLIDGTCTELPKSPASLPPTCTVDSRLYHGIPYIVVLCCSPLHTVLVPPSRGHLSVAPRPSPRSFAFPKLFGDSGQGRALASHKVSHSRAQHVQEALSGPARGGHRC